MNAHPIGLICVVTALACPVDAAALDLQTMKDRTEATVAALFDSSLSPGLRGRKARLAVQRCLDDLGPPDAPRAVAGIEPGDPDAVVGARLLAVCALAAYLVADHDTGDGWKGRAEGIDPTLASSPGLGPVDLTLGLQLEGALASARDPRTEPVTVDVGVDHPAPRLERFPPVAPGSYADLYVERANRTLRETTRGEHELSVPPGGYRIVAGQASTGFLVPSDPADRGPRTLVRVRSDEVGTIALETEHGDAGYVPPPGVAWPPPPPTPPVDWVGVSRNVSLVSAAVALAVGTGSVVAGQVGSTQAADLSRTAEQRRASLSLESDARVGALAGFSACGGLLLTAGILHLLHEE